MTHRRVQARVDLDALRGNFAVARRHAGDRAVWPVIKADAYGHGLLPVAHALAPEADGFCVADLDEGLTLRAAGIPLPILVMQGVHDRDGLAAAAAADLTVALQDPSQVALVADAGPRLTAGLPRMWLKVDTGMHRLGLDPDHIDAVRARLERLVAPGTLGTMTHFACADEPDHPLNARQLAALGRVRTSGPSSACNSAALVGGRCRDDDVVRPGIMLYGGMPLLAGEAVDLGLRPVMTLTSTLIAVKEVPAGDSVGYGAAWRAPMDTRIGHVAVGYGDGYPRHAPSGTPVRVAGVEVPLIGRVSMDSVAVDLTAAPAATVGSPVVLWGEELAVDRVARAADTIAYELLARLTPRVPRIHFGDRTRGAA